MRSSRDGRKHRGAPALRKTVTRSCQEAFPDTRWSNVFLSGQQRQTFMAEILPQLAYSPPPRGKEIQPKLRSF